MGFDCDSISPPRLLGGTKDSTAAYSELTIDGKLLSTRSEHDLPDDIRASTQIGYAG
jgi:hypothetical protein